MIIHTMAQRSEEWWQVRAGKITATSFPTMAAAKSKDTRETLCLKTAAERITGQPIEEPFCNGAMENGVETEAFAREAYETTTFAHVLEVGFVEMDEYIGVSPDGLVGDDGGVEVKCPMAHTHLKYLTSRDPWKAYKWQLQGALWVTNRKWWDFVSYCPTFPPEKQLFIQRVVPDMQYFALLHEGADMCRQRIKELVEAAA